MTTPCTTGDLAIAAIAFGNRYVRWSLAMIESLRRIGEFAGPIYLATDRTDAYEGLDGVHAIASTRPHDTLEAKRHKTTVLDWIPEGDVLYLDVDILMGAPLAPAIAAARRGDKPLAVFPQPDREGQPYHGGVVFVRRGAAAGDALDRWRREIDSGRHHRDQLALGAALHPEDVETLPVELLLFPGAESFANGEYRTFNHITMTATQRGTSPGRIARYVRGLGIETRPVVATDYWRYIRRQVPRRLRRTLRRWLGLENWRKKGKSGRPARVR